jgi:hypothetical protein
VGFGPPAAFLQEFREPRAEDLPRGVDAGDDSEDDEEAAAEDEAPEPDGIAGFAGGSGRRGGEVGLPDQGEPERDPDEPDGADDLERAAPASRFRRSSTRP